MPVQINEVVIKISVDADPAGAPAPAASAGLSDTGNDDAAIAALVLQIIKEKNER
ncbi:DUF5908 family protein [Taibaiella chishuiensis]|uniref:Uncharacterized protein n=1 Tax=Taibaiella chishuiensis TaxID=1434707 RepID=A0A2P8D8A1_9BACT|nr:DUF5908 family protein [Taibaiella chishuiensis]PSK93411.1 hypothetical protein B0I18_102381 [Taibaiella chishuiensis]